MLNIPLKPIRKAVEHREVGKKVMGYELDPAWLPIPQTDTGKLLPNALENEAAKLPPKITNRRSTLAALPYVVDSDDEEDNVMPLPLGIENTNDTFEIDQIDDTDNQSAIADSTSPIEERKQSPVIDVYQMEEPYNATQRDAVTLPSPIEGSDSFLDGFGRMDGTWLTTFMTQESATVSPSSIQGNINESSSCDEFGFDTFTQDVKMTERIPLTKRRVSFADDTTIHYYSEEESQDEENATDGMEAEDDKENRRPLADFETVSLHGANQVSMEEFVRVQYAFLNKSLGQNDEP